MQSLTEKFTDVISKELSKSPEKGKQKDFEKLLADMQNAGIVKKPAYDLPLVDTIGKTYYSTLNKRNNISIY